ncbi:MAG: RNA polymerase sigma factor [Candidatus Peribacteraceae bacterium]|jgi:RNA polymerase sigma-70 factor (ECF subfamily)
MEREEEVRLVEAARSDAQAFGVLFDMYYSRILRYVLRRVQDSALAQDITADTFFAALKKLDQFSWREGAGFSSWLYAIATNEIRQHFRRKCQRKELSLESMLETGVEFADPSDLIGELLKAEACMEQSESVAVLKSILRTLPTKYQEVLVLRYFEECSIEEIAIILHKHSGTVKSLLARGVEMLKRSFERLQLMQPFSSLRIVPSDTL